MASDSRAKSAGKEEGGRPSTEECFVLALPDVYLFDFAPLCQGGLKLEVRVHFFMFNSFGQ
jgi:hypothetical protein